MGGSEITEVAVEVDHSQPGRRTTGEQRRFLGPQGECVRILSCDRQGTVARRQQTNVTGQGSLLHCLFKGNIEEGGGIGCIEDDHRALVLSGQGAQIGGGVNPLHDPLGDPGGAQLGKRRDREVEEDQEPA